MLYESGRSGQPRHKVFVSYHHSRDQAYRNRFDYLFGHISDVVVLRSVQIGDLDPSLRTETLRQKIRDEYLRDSTVTVVLVGADTWKRKHVDWEIGASIRHTQYNPRSGLLGIILPTYPRPSPFARNNPCTTLRAPPSTFFLEAIRVRFKISPRPWI